MCRYFTLLAALAITVTLSAPTSAQQLRLAPRTHETKVAQFTATIFSGGAGNYVGPADAITPQPVVYYGLRGVSRSYASPGTHFAICIIDLSTCPSLGSIKILSNGNLDINGALTYAGVAGTGSCTISGTTVTCASGTGNIPQYSNLTGGGLTYPAFTITNCAAFPCTVTLNASQTVSVAETITFYNNMYIDWWYDQIGTACSGSACNITRSGGTNISLIANCQNGQPCAYDANQSYAANSQTLSPVVSLPVTFAAVGERLGSFTTEGILLNICTSCSTVNANWFWGTSANTITNNANSVSYNATAADSTPHSMIAVSNGASSVTNIDGTETTGSAGTFASASTMYFLSNSTGNAPPSAYLMEDYFYASALSQADRTALCGNMRQFWGISVSSHCN